LHPSLLQPEITTRRSYGLNVFDKDNRLQFEIRSDRPPHAGHSEEGHLSGSRRKFLKAGILAALFAAVPLKHILGQSWKDRDGNPGDGSSPSLQNNDPLATYTKATFLSYLNSVFQLSNGFTVVEVTLLKVNDMSPPKEGECFSLLFRGGSQALPQSTFTVSHPSLGRFPLFLVPAGPDDNGAQGYLATINRLSYKDELILAPRGTSTKRSGPVTSSPAPVNASPAKPQPAAPAISPTAPSPAKPVKKKKPSWKWNDDDDFGID